jgi:hypothetical protein
MLDLVLWSSSLALTPMAVDLAWRLIAGVAGLIGPAATEAMSPNKRDIDRAARRLAPAAAQEGVPWSPAD